MGQRRLRRTHQNGLLAVRLGCGVTHSMMTLRLKDTRPLLMHPGRLAGPLDERPKNSGA